MKKGALYGLISVAFFVAFLGLAFLSVQRGNAEEAKPAPAEQTAPQPATPAGETSMPANADGAATTAVETPAETTDSTENTSGLPDVIMTLALGDRSIGDPNAPVSIIEYASMTCSHCAHFHNTIFADLKKQYIDTGKVRLTMRDFPLDDTALKAAMMARCAPKENYFNLVEVIFSSQQRWISSDDRLDALKKLGKLAGLSEAGFESCMKNKDLEVELLKRMQEGQTQWGIKSTPTFIFNMGATQFSGAEDIAQFQKAIDPLLQQTKGQ